VSSVLLVEDDETIGRALRSALTSQRYVVIWVRTGSAALNHEQEVDLVLLDLGLPDLDGVEVCRQLRVVHRGAVIVILTARDGEIDVILGLEAGADDYLVKPVRLSELLARLRAHLRRASTPLPQAPVRTVGALRIDLDARRAWVHERELDLRAKEFDLLARLAADPGQLVTRETLMAEVWDENWYGSTKTLDVHIAALRRKLADIPADADPSLPSPTVDTSAPVVVTLRGRGYRLQASSSTRG
jgi:DNA-binding response OmpR family regulator